MAVMLKAAKSLLKVTHSLCSRRFPSVGWGRGHSVCHQGRQQEELGHFENPQSASGHPALVRVRSKGIGIPLHRKNTLPSSAGLWETGVRAERESTMGTAFSFCLFLLCFFPFSMKTWSSFSKKGKREGGREEGRGEREREYHHDSDFSVPPFFHVLL